MAKQAKLSQEILNIILYHHERYDGKGYPAGIKGEDIPLEARIVKTADLFDAIITERSYHANREYAEARNIILSMKGTAFDPKIVEIFPSLINDKGTKGRKNWK